MRSFTVARLAPLAIFVAALIANHRAASSLLVWSDTIYEQSHGDRCLADDQCTLVGTQAHGHPRARAHRRQRVGRASR